MSKRAILRLDGSLEEGFRVTLEVGEEGILHMTEGDGYLAANPDLIARLQQWQSSYHDLSQGTRIKVNTIKVQKAPTRSVETCRSAGQALQQTFKAWLESESFRSIDLQLREAVSHDELVRVVIRTKDRRLHSLPWHTWGFIDHYQAEVAFSLPARQVESCASRQSSDRVKILAILGHQAGIDVKTDRALLEALPRAEVKFLVEPDRQTITQQLWEQDWDILFFAGHSQTQEGSGVIHINPEDSLGIEDLKFGLRRAIAHGLQLAIFNSCDGLGLVYEVEQLGLPQMVVMRQPVPDPVAQEFLKQLLLSFVGGKRFYLAVREAREQLQGFEQRYPCASWLPIIFQNLTQPPLSWADLPSSQEPKQNKPGLPITPRKKLRLRTLVLISLMATGLVCGGRSLGWLESLELGTYDKMMQSRVNPAQSLPILIVAANDADVQKLGRPLSDQTIYDLLEKIGKHQPRVIGLDIYRDAPIQNGWSSLIKKLQQSDRTVALCRVGEVENGIAQPKTAIAPPPGLPPNRSGFSDSLVPDPDNVIRRYALAMEPRKGSLCSTANSFSFQVVRQHLQPEAQYKLQSATGIEITTATSKASDSTVRIPRLQPNFGGYHRPTADMLGYQLLINYRQDQSFQKISLIDVLNASDADLQQLVENHIVLVGYESGDKDYHLTPIGKLYGVTIHAHVIRQVLDLVLHQRPLIVAWPKWGETLWIGICSALGAVVVYPIRASLPVRIIIAIILFVVVSGGLISLSQAFWLPLVPSALAFSLTSSAVLFPARISQKLNFHSTKRAPL